MNDEYFKVESRSPNFRTQLARQLSELSPELVADGQIDISKLVELLGEDASNDGERFGLFWAGKKKALRASQEPTTATLRPVLEESVDWETTKNVFIEGDNLEVLKILQKRYHNQIKMIYIDPPYNTGKDFVYPDNYKEGLQTYLEYTNQADESGRKTTSNSEVEGRYHSNWLNMMYPRLKLARNLLSDDGVVFISIDDNELDNLLKLTNEIFGETNHVATFAWKKRGTGGQVAKNAIIKQVEYILLYARSVETLNLSGTKNANEGEEGFRDFRKAGGQWQRKYRPNQFFPFYMAPDGSLSLEYTDGAIEILPRDSNGVEGFWENGVETTAKRLEQGEFRARETKSGWKIQQREIAKATSNAGSFIDIPSTRGTEEIKSLLGSVVFENPKPTELIQYLATIANLGDKEICLDFFAGSASTADAIIKMNAEDGLSRQFILVQLPEPTAEDSEAKQAGFDTISQLSRGRINAASARAKQIVGSQLSDTNSVLDSGYRTYKLVDTNFTKWRVTSDIEPNLLEQHLLSLRDSSDDDATPDALLTELLLKQGYSLVEDISDYELSGLKLKSVGQHLLLAYLNEHVKPSIEQLRAVVDAEPAKFLILEDAFHGDDELKTNLVQMCKTKSVELWTA